METGSRPSPSQAPAGGIEPTSERRSTTSVEPGLRAEAHDPHHGHPSDPTHRPTGPERPRRRRSLWPWVIIALVIAALAWFLFVPHGGPEGSTTGRGGRGGRGGFANAPTTVSVAQAQRGDVPIYLNELGAVTPLATVTIQSQIAGYLTEIGFKEGQMVAKGQFLAQIDPRPYQAQLLSAQGALARDQAALAEAQLDLKRYRLLLSQDSIASQQVDTQAATVLQDQGTVKTDEASIATAKLNIAYAHITSPVAGRVGLRQVDVGNYVTSGLTNGLVVVTQLQPIDVEFTLPEDSLPQVTTRIRSGAALPVVAYDRTGAVQLATGQLLTLDNVVDPTTGTVKAKARFSNAAGTLFPQQFVNVRVLVDTLADTIVAPTSAVLRGPQGLFVYVVTGGTNAHSVTVRQVKSGPSAGLNTAVTSGLRPGETVVTDGTDRLREGAKVILPGDCIPSMGPGGSGGRGGRHSGGAGGPGHAGGPGRGGCAPGQQRSASGGGQASGAQASAGSAGGANDGPQGGTPAGQSEGQGKGQGGRMQAMLAQLNLDPTQQAKAQAIFGKARADAMASAANAGDDPDARHAAMRQAYGQAFAQLEPILRPDQKAKLAQLRAQMAASRGQGGDQGGAPGGDQ